jgi:hypothetical protein
MKVEEGRFVRDDNRPSAESDGHLRAYFARKRIIVVRSALLVFSVAACVAIGWPVLGLDLALGGIGGVVNMLLIMRNNERFLNRTRSQSAYGLRNTLRIVVVGLIPVLAAAGHPWWYMLVGIAGILAPLALYSFELRREMSTG